jgi:hypothetical protein
MKPSSCKAKGRRFQQKIAKSIRDAFPILLEDDVRSTSMGASGEDILLSTRARECLPLALECKCVEKLNVWQCLEQASRHGQRTGALPVLVFSRNHADAYAVLPWSSLLSLYAERSSPDSLPPALASLLREISQWAPPLPPPPPYPPEGE